MDPVMPRPTSTETAYSDRLRIVQLAAQGWTRPAIATELGRSVRTVQRWLARARREGLDALAYRSRQPHTRHPLTTDPVVVDRIATLRQMHPGWGARLIRRQLLLEGWPGVPSEGTVGHWLRRLGYPPAPVVRHKPLGWTTSPSAPGAVVWQMDFKEKGGTGTPVLWKGIGAGRVC